MMSERKDRTEVTPGTGNASATRRTFLRRLGVGAGAAAAVGAALPAVAREPGAPFGSEPFIGEITMFAGNFAPRGWAFCEGQTLPISGNDALFSILGTTYGGDGRKTFGLPDLKKQENRLGGVRHIIAVQGIYPSRS
jgi:hypothetical protein